MVATHILDVRCWHQPDLPGRLLFGRFQEQSGHLPATAEQSRFMSTRPRPRPLASFRAAFLRVQSNEKKPRPWEDRGSSIVSLATAEFGGLEDCQAGLFYRYSNNFNLP